MSDINWYPGHMAKSRRLLAGQLKAVDAVVELCDARAPFSTRNPDLRALCRGKAHVLVLNKADLANEGETNKWISHYGELGLFALPFRSIGGKKKAILTQISKLTADKVDRLQQRGVNKTVRLMVIGIPNVGKSTFINCLRGQNIAKAADRPGVTRSHQWVKVGPYLELLDTPGMLWPKLSDQMCARNLAFLGSIRDQIMDSEELAGQLLERLMELAPHAARQRFRMEGAQPGMTGHELLDMACAGRGWIRTGALPDIRRGAALVLDEYRAGKVGRITLEKPQ
ncbi:MAG: ribosome biogenesis GTPase YlqF [Candidatus Excrementavichristensenella sp.]|jgi:ribosome biogenesis GTPase A